MAYRSSSQYAPGTNGTSWVIPVPAGAAVGDIVSVGGYKEDAGAVTPPDGTWNLKATLNTSATLRGSIYVYWKRLTAADTGTYTFTWSTSAFRAAAAVAHSGRASSGDPFDGTVGTAESTTGVTTLNVSTSPTGSNGDAVGFWTNFNGGGAFTAPTNYTQRQSVSGVIALETWDAVASGSTGNVTATNTITDFMKAFLGVLALDAPTAVDPNPIWTPGFMAANGFPPFLLSTPQSRYPAALAYDVGQGAIGATGAAAVTQADQTSSASGQLGYSGTSAATETNDTSSATGTVINPVTGTAAVTQANQTSSASGQLGYSGTSALTQANQTSSASGQLGYSGTAAPTEAADTSTASGTFTGTGISGNAAVTQAAQTASASGTFTAGSVSGSAAVTQANQTASATGKLGYSGTAAANQANQTSTASGTVINPITGTASPTQANQFSIANGILRYTGTAAVVEAADIAAATGVVSGPISGTAAVVQANQTVVAVGTFTALVSFGTASAATGQAPTASTATVLTAAATAGSAAMATASSGSSTAPSASFGAMTVPTATGG